VCAWSRWRLGCNFGQTIDCIIELIDLWLLSHVCWGVGVLTMAVIAFLRSATNIRVISANLCSRGLSGLADMVSKLSVPGFAEWRWMKLNKCCRQLGLVWESLRVNFDATLFANAKDATQLSKVLFATTSVVWTMQFEFVAWFCKHLGEISSWIGGCACHEHDFVLCIPVDCWKKGRRLHEAYFFATQALSAFLEEANSWTQAYM
jgi:hypothetical protein